MSLSIILLIIFRFFLQKNSNKFGRCIYWFSSISIMLSTMTIIVLLSIMNGFEKKIKRNFLYFTPHILLTNVKGYMYGDTIIPHEILQKKLDVIYMQPLIISDVILQSSAGIAFGSMLGINPKYFEPLSNYCINNNVHQLVVGKYNIILGIALAKLLAVNINDTIRLIIPSVYNITPLGHIFSQRLFTVSDIYITDTEIDSYQVLIHQIEASTLMRYPTTQCITGWRLWLRDPFVINNFNNFQFSGNWEWKDWRKDKGFMFQAMQIEKNMMSLLLGLVVIASVLNIVSFLSLLIIEKKLEIFILKMLGLNRLQIVSIFVIQGIGVGSFGMIIGTGLGIFLSSKLNKILSFFYFLDIPQIPVEIRFLQIFIIIVLTFFLVFLITLLPLWKMFMHKINQQD